MNQAMEPHKKTRLETILVNADKKLPFREKLEVAVSRLKFIIGVR